MSDRRGAPSRGIEREWRGPDVINSSDYPDAVRVREQRIDVGGSNFEYVFPAHLIAVMLMEAA